MDSSAFDVARWDHWLLILGFVCLSAYGLWLSWQWRPTVRRRVRSRLARQLAVEVHARRMRLNQVRSSLNRDGSSHVDLHPTDAQAISSKSVL